ELDAIANRGPSTSGVRMSSWVGGRSPRASATTSTEPVDVDQATTTGELGWKPVPVTVTMVPGGPTPGLSVNDGAPRAGVVGDVGVVGNGGVVGNVGDVGTVAVVGKVTDVGVVEVVGGAGTAMGRVAARLASQDGVCPGPSTTTADARRKPSWTDSVRPT